MSKRKYKCPKCSHNEVLREDNVRICLSCGFQSLPTYTKNSDIIKQVRETSPKIVKELMFYDEKLKQYWLPSILNVNKKGMVFPEGNKNEWKWAFAPYVSIPVFERINYKIPGKEDEYYEYRLGIEKVEYFDIYDFLGAILKLGVKVEDLI